MALKKTPIYPSHVEEGGRIVEFAGFLMPVSFDGIVAEHELVRTGVGLFDVSHMGEIEITGSAALSFADYIVTNNVSKLADGQICYATACNEEGKVLDDLLVYRFSAERILFVVNAVNTGKIFEHMGSVVKGDVRIRNLSEEIGQIAVQGPDSRELLLSSSLCDPVKDRIRELVYYRFITFDHKGKEVILSRTGYTGELGFEIYLRADDTLEAWMELLDAGADLGARPIGLGARDTLRFEPCYCLYGHELDEKTSPLEAGLSWVVKLKKGAFIGRGALEKEKSSGPPRKLVGFEVTGRGIPRQGYTVLQGDAEVGKVTSGTFSPTLKKALAMALVTGGTSMDGDEFSIDIRGRRAPAGHLPLPFYSSRSSD
jgi:aminomethyltransferase